MQAALIISIVSIFIAFSAVIISLVQTRAAMQQTRTASESLHQMTLGFLFNNFSQASHISFNNPDVLYAVDGLEKSVPPEEAKNIAYLGLLIDSFEQFYGYKYDEDFSKMFQELREKPTYINNLLAIKENQARWNTIKQLHYSSIDESFVKAIDELIKHIESEKQG